MSKSDKTIQIEHLRNLVAIAFSDGFLDENAEDFLYDKADELELPYDEVDNIIKNAEKLKFIVPINIQDREDQLADIVFMAMIDGDIHKREYDLCLSIAQKLDLTKSDLDKAIELTKKLWDC